MHLSQLSLALSHFKGGFLPNKGLDFDHKLDIPELSILIGYGGSKGVIGQTHVTLHINHFFIVHIDLTQNGGRSVVHVNQTSLGTLGNVVKGQRALTIGFGTHILTPNVGHFETLLNDNHRVVDQFDLQGNNVDAKMP